MSDEWWPDHDKNSTGCECYKCSDERIDKLLGRQRVSDICPDCKRPKDAGRGWHRCAEDGGKGVEIDDLRDALAREREENARLRDAAVKASAELRHATRGRQHSSDLTNWYSYDANLIDRAVVILERAALSRPTNEPEEQSER